MCLLSVFLFDWYGDHRELNCSIGRRRQMGIRDSLQGGEGLFHWLEKGVGLQEGVRFTSDLGQASGLVRLLFKQQGQGTLLGGQLHGLQLEAHQPVTALGEHLARDRTRIRDQAGMIHLS